MKACTGPGKTTVLSWIAWNFLLTRPHPVCGATSISGDNLRSNFWPELARWRAKAPLLEYLFEQTKGIQAFKMLKQRDITSDQGAAIVNREWTDFDADAAFVDGTGGFGSGWVDQLIRLGRSPISVHFAANAHQHGRYFNKRAEMYFEAVQWIKRGGALPESRELMRALTETTYTHRGDKLIIEPKEIVKQRLGFSPDEADAFVLTFAEPVQPRSARSRRQRSAVSGAYLSRENA
jgi:hypothetical protein